MILIGASSGLPLASWAAVATTTGSVVEETGTTGVSFY